MLPNGILCTIGFTALLFELCLDGIDRRKFEQLAWKLWTSYTRLGHPRPTPE